MSTIKLATQESNAKLFKGIYGPLDDEINIKQISDKNKNISKIKWSFQTSNKIL